MNGALGYCLGVAAVDGALVGRTRTLDVLLIAQEVAKGDYGDGRFLGMAAVDGALVGGTGTLDVSLPLKQEPKAERRPSRRRRAAAAGDMLEYVSCAFLVALADQVHTAIELGHRRLVGLDETLRRIANEQERCPVDRLAVTAGAGGEGVPGPGDGLAHRGAPLP